MKLMHILLEGRKEDLRAKYIKSMDPEILDWVLGISDLQDFNHKYTDFVLRTLNKEGEDLEGDIDDVITMLKYFDKHNSQLEKKDINQYKSTSELFNAIKPIQEKEHQKVMESKVEKVYEDDGFLVLLPLSLPATCKYGSGTKWCVTQKDGQHFERYTSGEQKLYFILRKKGKQGQPFYKIAVHFDPNGNATWWDSEDRTLTSDAIKLFKEYNEDVWMAIKGNFETNRVTLLQKVKQIFDIDSTNYTNITKKFLGNNQLVLKIEGFENIPDMPKHAMGRLSIIYNNQQLDEYDLFVVYDVSGVAQWKADISLGGDSLEDIRVDFGLDYKNMQPKFTYTTPEQGWKQITNYISFTVSPLITSNPSFISFVHGGRPVWEPSLSYGYTFGENKGLIKKLVDWLDTGKKGTRLDFMTDIGVFEKLEVDGKTKYKRPNGTHLYNPNDLRGQYSSFFASAVLSGILKNVKEGKKFILTKGPNFEAFKEGKLKAL